MKPDDDDDKAGEGGHFTWRSSRWISLIISSAYALDIFAWTSVSTIDLSQELTLIECMFHLKNVWLSSASLGLGMFMSIRSCRLCRTSSIHTRWIQTLKLGISDGYFRTRPNRILSVVEGRMAA